ncbi:MAG: DUF6665 family protein [Candidatus Rokuibacteriota bacterium]
MTRAREGFQRLEREIVAEKAAALDGAVDRAVRERLGGEYDAACREAEQARLVLLIQREAVGLRQHRVVDQQFPAPPRRRP